MAEKATLEKYDYSVVTAHTGEAAVEMIRTEQPVDLILMDVDLGSGINGAEAAERILAIRHLPIVFLTSHSEREYVEKVKEITRYGYVIKNSGEFVLWDAIEVAFELYEAHEELERFFTVNLDLLCIANFEGRFLKVNRAWEEILGHAKQDLEGAGFLDFVHPDDVEATRRAMEHLDAGGNVVDFVNRYRDRDGKYRYIEWRSHPSGDRIYAAARDITERIETERALRESEERYRRLVEQAPVGIFRTTSDGRALSVNIAMARMLGFGSPEETIGYYTNLAEQLYAHASRREEFLGTLARVGSINAFEIEARRRDGSTVWLSLSARVSGVHYDGSFEIEGFASDISRRKRAEEEKRRALDEYETVFNTTQDALFLVDVSEDGAFRYARNNRAHERATNLTEKRIRGKSPRELLGDEVGPRIESYYRTCRDERVPVSYELVFGPRGERWSNTLTPVVEGDRVTHIVGTVRKVAAAGTDRTD